MINFRKLAGSFRFAFEGMSYVYKFHQSFRVPLFIAFIVVPLGIILGLSETEFLFVFASIALVFITEMLNTAIEELSDLITRDYKKEIKIAKNISAAASLIAVIFSAVVGVIIFIPRMIFFFR